MLKSGTHHHLFEEERMRNNLLTEKLFYTGSSKVNTSIKLCSYNATDVEETESEAFQPIAEKLSNNRINWVNVCGLRNVETIEDICEHFEIDFLVLQDLLNVSHPTKIEEHDNYIVLILKLFAFNKEDEQSELDQQQICLIQGANYVLCFTENRYFAFDEVAAAIRNNTLKIRAKQSDYLLSVLLNSVMANYTQIITAIDERLEDLEEELLNITSAADIGIQIQSLRKQYLQIKRAVLPLKEQYVKLLRSDSHLMHKVNRAFFNDVNDHLQFVLQNIEICRETLASLVDLYISNNDLKMNDIMKRLTVVSTIFIPLTFLAGMWGMNFKFMPELEWSYGYLFAWLLMCIIGFVVYLFFKKKKWY